MVIFTNDNFIKWIFGTPFIRKYQFVYDFDNKQIGYYHDKFKKEINYDDDNDNNNNKKTNEQYITTYDKFLSRSLLSIRIGITNVHCLFIPLVFVY